MKTLLKIALAVSAFAAQAVLAAGAADLDAGLLSGQVLETQDAAGYTYLRLKTKTGETWVAVNQQVVKKGAVVSIENSMVMTDFESKALHKTFPSIVFGNIHGDTKDAANPHGDATVAKADLSTANISKATGPNARTVAEVVSGAKAFKDKPVEVHGKVVKFNAGIMGKNWVHLRDGSGKEADGSNDILATTLATTQVGAVVTVSGTVRTDKDFGAGYAYKVLIEEASLK
jgi:hypothetical protein